jgi:hypothetical protein
MMLTKQCGCCRKRFNIEAFYNDSTKGTGKCSYCIPCKRLYSANRRARNRQRNLNAKLKAKACVCHGIEVTKQNHWQFEWDHIEPQNKVHTIGEMGLASDLTFYEELQKCRLVCVDWHRQHTRQQHIDGVFKIPEQQEIEHTPIEQVWQLSLFEEH